jgi:hypothetical protein
MALKRETIAIADIYVPVKGRATLDQRRVDETSIPNLGSFFLHHQVRFFQCQLISMDG